MKQVEKDESASPEEKSQEGRWLISFVFWMALLLQAVCVFCGDVIYLHNGSSEVGEIIQSEPFGFYVLKKQDETVKYFNMDDVWKVEFESKGVYEDCLRLKSGVDVSGEIIGSIPNEIYRIKTREGLILIFKMDEVSRVEFREGLFRPLPDESDMPGEPERPFFPEERMFSFGLFVGSDPLHVEGVDEALKTLEHSLRGWATDEESQMLIKNLPEKRGWSGGFSFEKELTPNIGMIVKGSFSGYPTFGLNFRGKTKFDPYPYYKDLHYEREVFLPSSLTLVGGINLGFPIGGKFFLRGEGFLGYGLGMVVDMLEEIRRRINSETGAVEIEHQHEHLLSTGETGLLWGLEGILEFRFFHPFSLIGTVGYRKSYIGELTYTKGCEECGIEIGDRLNFDGKPLSLDFSGLYLSGELRITF